MTAEQTLQDRLTICASDSMIIDHERCMFEAADRIDDLERQLAEAHKDQAHAKRYRWLSAQYIPTRAILSGQTAWIINVESHLPIGETFDQAIDAAIAQQQVKDDAAKEFNVAAKLIAHADGYICLQCGRWNPEEVRHFKGCRREEGKL